MKHKKKSSIFIATLLISLLSVANTEVLAVPKKGDILIQSIYGSNEGIFSEKDGLWQPGMEKTREFVIINNSDDDIKFKELYITDKGFKYTDEYMEFIGNTDISILDGGELLYKGSFKDIFNNSYIKLDDSIAIKKAGEKILEIKIETLDSMNNTANSDMKIGLDFSLGINYELLESDAEVNADADAEKESNSNTGNSIIPVTGGIMGSLDKMVVAIGILLTGVLIVNKPLKKGDESND